MSRFIAATLALAATAAAHGIVTSASADGVTERGYNPEMQWTDPNAKVVGWTTPQNIELAYVALSNPTNPDIICQIGATNAQKSINVKAGSSVDLQWSPWPESHHGPVIDYLASCNGECSKVDKTALKFFKIDEAGLLDGTFNPGKWASDQLIANGNKWSVKIPSNIPAGEYVLRHEIIALHAAHEGRAESYPQCINIKVSGGSGSVPDGVVGTQLYKSSDPGIQLDIYKALGSYKIPGPAVFAARAASADPTSSASSSAAAPATTSSSAAASSTPGSSAAASSTPASTSTPATPATSTTQPSETTPAVTSPATVPTATDGAGGEYGDDDDENTGTGSIVASTSSASAPASTGYSRGRKGGKGRGRKCSTKGRNHVRDFS